MLCFDWDSDILRDKFSDLHRGHNLGVFKRFEK